MIQLKIYLQALRQNWWMVALTAVVAAVATFLISNFNQPVYETRLQLLIVPNMNEFEGRELIQSLDTLDKRSIVATYVEVADSGRIRREAIQTTGLGAVAALDYQLRAVALPEANIVELSASGPERDNVAALANAAAARTTDYVSETYDIYRLEQLDPAPVPLSPISPTPWRNAGLALVLGLALGGVLAIVRNQIREPLSVSLREWQARDPDSTAYKRNYMEYQLGKLLPEEAPHLMVAVVQMEGLIRLDLPPQLKQNFMRRVVELMRGELPGRDFVGRWDDHSFAVIMRRVTSLEEAYQKLERLQQELSRQPIEVYPGGETVNLAPRLGAVISHEGDTTTSLNERLSQALVKAEKNGREPTLYQHEMLTQQAEEI